ncbi:hypothetical protein ABGB07_33940 [Micromonosporaceae bacterium B7E4]
MSMIGAVVVLLLGLAAPASAGGSTAASGGATILAGPCGSSYALVGHHPVGNQITDKIDMYLDVYYSSTARRNCLVANHSGDAYGQTRYSLAKIRPSGSAWPACPSVGCDQGNYAYYAGPVYTPAGVDMSHRCVDIAGMAGIQVDKILYNQHCG